MGKAKLLMATPYFPPGIGGLERYASEMAKVAQQANYEVVVVCSGEGRSIIKESVDGISIYRLPRQYKLQNTPLSLRWYGMIKKIIADEAPDIINVHTPVPFLADIVILASKNIPSVVTYHAGSMKKHVPVVDLFIDVYERLILPIMLNKTNRIISSSDYVRNTFLRRYRSKSVSISPGVDVSVFTRRTTIPDDNKIIFVGNFTNGWKGLNYLREGIKNLPSVHLVVVGTGIPITSARTKYLGVLEGDELVKVIQSSKILVLPSISNAESFGMVLIEAMACGVPVIGSKVGGIPDVINDEEDGLIVEPRNVSSLVRAIQRLIDDPLLADRLSEAAYRKVVSQYTWRVQGAKYLDLLDQVLQAG